MKDAEGNELFCGHCESRDIVTTQESYSFVYGDKKPVTLAILAPLRTCKGCEAQWWDWETEELAQGTVEEHLRKQNVR